MTALNADQRKARLASLAKWGLGLVGAILIAPFIFLAVKGIVGLAAAMVIGLGIIHGAPVLGMKFANWKLKAIKYEASRNPVETMQEVFREKSAAVEVFARRVEDFATEVRNFADKLGQFKKDFPDEADKFVENLAVMERGLSERKRRLEEARQELTRFRSEIRKVDGIWQMSLAANKMHRAAGMTEDSFMQRIKTETAIDAVQSSLNRALSQLETSLSKDVLAIEAKDPSILDVQSIEVRERVGK